jgi:SAM-dependent methyltransferase
VEWRQADAVALPFEAAAFDALVCQFGFMFVPDKAAAFREARRVLRPGSPLLFSVWDRIEANPFANAAHDTIGSFFETPPTFYSLPFSFHDPAAIRAHLEAARFVDVAIERTVRPAVSPSTRDFAHGLVEGNPIAHAIQDAGLAFAPIVDAVATVLRRVGGDAPFRSETRALLVSARAGPP